MSRRLIGISGPATLAVLLAGAWLAGRTTLYAWLAAVLTWLLPVLGALAVLMTHGLTGGRWGERSAPWFRAGVAVLPWLLLALAPLLFALDTLFAWTAPPADLPEAVRHKTFYLNEPFFIARSLIFAALWLALAVLLGIWRGRERRVHAPGLILWVFSLTFFGYDWLMSLEPLFYSDVFGLVLVADAAAAAFAVVLLVGSRRLPPDVLRDLGHLWLTLLLGWVFLMFSQYIIVWQGNLPAEIGWYLNRGEGLWRPVGWLAFGLFFLWPFALILLGALDRPGWPPVAAGGCLIGHWLHLHWLVLPAFGPPRPVLLWLAPALSLALGALCLGLARHHLDRHEEARHG